MHASDMGVWHCALPLRTASIPELAGRTNFSAFTLHVFLRYMLAVNGSAIIRGTLVPDEMSHQTSLQAFSLSGAAGLNPVRLAFNPGLQLTGNGSSGTRQQRWNLTNVTAVLTATPVTVSAFPRTFTALLQPPPRSHEFKLACALPGQGTQTRSCTFRASSLTHRLHSKGVRSEPIMKTGRELPTEAAVVVAPLFNVHQPAVVAQLIDWHIQHHVMLGVSRYAGCTRLGTMRSAHTHTQVQQGTCCKPSPDCQ